MDALKNEGSVKSVLLKSLGEALFHIKSSSSSSGGGGGGNSSSRKQAELLLGVGVERDLPGRPNHLDYAATRKRAASKMRQREEMRHVRK